MEKTRTLVGNLLGAAAVATGLWVAIGDHVAAATACLSAGILILLLANINHFEFIKGFGFEAKTKKLDEKIEEADRLLVKLRLASQLFADISIQLMSRAGRWSGPIPKTETQDLVSRIHGLLASLDVNATDIDKSLDPFHRITLRDLAASYFNAFFAELDKRTSLVRDAMAQRAAEERARTGAPIASDDEKHCSLQEMWKLMQEFAQEVRQEYEKSSPFSLGDLLEHSVANAPGWTETDRHAFLKAVKPMLDEWKFYVKHRRINDVDSWLAREYGH